MPGNAFLGRQKHAVGLEVAQARAGSARLLHELLKVGMTPQMIRQ
jgi:hypothetical protein